MQVSHLGILKADCFCLYSRGTALQRWGWLWCSPFNVEVSCFQLLLLSIYKKTKPLVAWVCYYFCYLKFIKAYLYVYRAYISNTMFLLGQSVFKAKIQLCCFCRNHVCPATLPMAWYYWYLHTQPSLSSMAVVSKHPWVPEYRDVQGPPVMFTSNLCTFFCLL